jgi:hypothetical protein
MAMLKKKVPIHVVGRKYDATGNEIPDTKGAKLNKILVFKGGKYSKEGKAAEDALGPTEVKSGAGVSVSSDTSVKDIVAHNKAAIEATPNWGTGAKQNKKGGPGTAPEPNLKVNNQIENQKNLYKGHETRPENSPKIFKREIASEEIKKLLKKKKGGD